MSCTFFCLWSWPSGVLQNSYSLTFRLHGSLCSLPLFGRMIWSLFSSWHELPLLLLLTVSKLSILDKQDTKKSNYWTLPNQGRTGIQIFMHFKNVRYSRSVKYSRSIAKVGCLDIEERLWVAVQVANCFCLFLHPLEGTCSYLLLTQVIFSSLGLWWDWRLDNHNYYPFIS